MSGALGHVVVVDDEEHVRHVARLVIEDETHVTVSEASSGAEAIALCVEQDVDVLVLDLHMPDQDGLQVLRTLNNLSDRPSVIAWSADEVALRRAVDLGAEAKVDKTDIDGLNKAIRFCLHLRGKDVPPR